MSSMELSDFKKTNDDSRSKHAHLTESPSVSKKELGTLQSMSSFTDPLDSSNKLGSPSVSSKNAALRDDVLLDVKYLKDVYQGLDDENHGQ